MTRPRIFNEDDVRKMRAAINGLRQPGAYEPGKWMVSYLNREQEVVQGHFPKKVHIRDITIRTTEQMPGVVVPEQERRDLARAIAKFGVSEMETGSFGRETSTDDMRAMVDAVKEVNSECQVLFCGTRGVDDVEQAIKGGLDFITIPMAPWIGAAAIYSGTRAFADAWAGKDWREGKYPNTFEEAIERRRPMYETALAGGMRVSAALNMLPYAHDDYVRQYCAAVAEMGAFEIVLLDGPSGLGPEAYVHLVKIVQETAPHCRVGVHTHNMFDLATANAIACAREGVELLELAVNGYCAAAGQADISVVAMALKALYGIETGINLEMSYDVARQAEAMTGYKVAWNNPITGPEVFNWGGMEQLIGEQDVDTMVHWNIEPTYVGSTRKWDITRDSGPYAMWQKLDELGVTNAEKRHIEPILLQCKALIQEKRRTITEDEIRAIAAEVMSADANAV